MRDMGRKRVRVDEFVEVFPQLRDAMRENDECNGLVVTLLGILERIAGLARLGGGKQKSQGSRGGANGGSVARLAQRLHDAQR